MTAGPTTTASARALIRRLLPPTGPQRALAGSVFAVTIGGGMMFSSSLYLTRIIGSRCPGRRPAVAARGTTPSRQGWPPKARSGDTQDIRRPQRHLRPPTGDHPAEP
ncbi:hypothetical protein [Micromonospora craniellae]|uniref:Uncharacterized protein n=1 Tax=Micromonospora craniellae TaxID=2294034 RepID=A0A372FTW7_9ACTN|nr:hypothetical protein [Micromonospora craniellae]RFS44016.1 hypothetical protein D0Q02_24400 [Micromonospora craniellae]